MARIGFLGFRDSRWVRRIGLRPCGRAYAISVMSRGSNIVIEFRWAEGKYDRLSALVAELIRLNADVIVTHGTPGTHGQAGDHHNSYRHGDQRRRHRDRHRHEPWAARSERHGIDLLFRNSMQND